MFRFGNPLAFLLLLVVACAAFARARFGRGRSPRILFPDRDLLRKAALPAGPLSRHLLPFLRFAALVLLIVAAARPQAGHRRVQVDSEGIDIMIALDVSGSMRAEDFKPQNRLTVAKQVVRGFVAGRQSDRIGLVVFAGRAFLQCPPTLDYAVYTDLLAAVDMGMMEDGTAIGSALASSVNRLRGSTAKSRVVILVTDGVNNAGNVDPETAARVAATMGIKVYTIGVGRPGGQAPFPVNDPFFGRRTVMMEAPLDEKMLQAIAKETGGEYHRAVDPAALASIFARIGELEKTKIESVEFTDYDERAPLFLLPAIGLLLIEGGLAATRFLAVP